MSLPVAILMQIAVSVQVADTIPARTPVSVVIRATAPGNTAPRLSTPTVNGAAMQLVTDVTRLGGGFGQAIATREIRYTLRASSTGTLTIAPVIASLGTQQVVSPVKTVFVQPPPTNAVPAIVMRAPVSHAAVVNFHALVTPDTVWAGEQVTLQVGVFIDDELRSRLQRNPEYVAPQVDGAVAYDLPVANDALPTRNVEGARYRPFVFARALFPLRAGQLAVPPARLSYTLGSAGTIFGRQERQTSSTTADTVVVRELPAAGRPASFAGAVGVYVMSATVEKTTGRVGDAVQLTVKLQGAGNVKLLPAPLIDIPSVTSSAAGESIVVDSSDLLVRGSKTFRFLLTPKKDGELPLGVLKYAFFNPVRGVYEEAVAPLGALRVAPGTAVADDSAEVRTPALPLQSWSVESATDVTEAWWFRGVFLALGIPWLALVARRLWRRLPTREPRERRRSRRGAGPRVIGDPASVRRTFIHGLTPVVALRSDQPFTPADIVHRLRRAGVTSSVAEAAGALLTRLDLLTFGNADMADERALGTLATECDEVIAQLHGELSSRTRQRLQAAARSVLLVLAAQLVLSVVSMAQPASFAAGADAYARRQFTQAAIDFAAAAAESPHSATAWSNLGNAHWMRADTAGAILAWQRSVRLLPRRNPAARHLSDVQPVSDVRTAILPLSADEAWLMLLGVSLVLSVSGAAWRWTQRRISNTALFLATLLVAACAAVSVFAQRSALADGMVVVRRDVPLRTEPALASEAAARARAGEVALLQEARGTWRLVRVPSGRSGWVEAEAIRSLALADGRDVALAESRFAADSTAP